MIQAIDSTIVGKREFLYCYQKARTTGLISKNIINGWKAAGLWPVNMAKPLMSGLLLKGIVLQPGQTFRDLIYTPQALRVPLKLDSASKSIIWTPRKSRDLREQVYQSNLINQHTPTQRLLFQKVSKALDEKECQLASTTARIDALERQVEALKPQKRKRVETSPNSRFADIRRIQRAQEEESEIVISSDESGDVESISSVVSCIEVGLDVEE